MITRNLQILLKTNKYSRKSIMENFVIQPDEAVLYEGTVK